METFLAVGISVVGAAGLTLAGWVVKTLFQHDRRITGVESKLNGRLTSIEKKIDKLLNDID